MINHYRHSWGQEVLQEPKLHRIFGILHNSQHHDSGREKLTVIMITLTIALTIMITPALAFTITLTHRSRPRSRLLVKKSLVIRSNARPEIGRGRSRGFRRPLPFT